MEPLWSPWLQPLNRGTARRVDSRLQRAFGHEWLGRRFEEERPNLLEPVARLSVAETGAAMPTYRGTNHVAAQRGVKS